MASRSVVTTTVARSLRYWWRHDEGMLEGRFVLPDLDGALVESALTRMIDTMTPAKGRPSESGERRGADALVELARNDADVHAVSGPTPRLVVEVPPRGAGDARRRLVARLAGRAVAGPGPHRARARRPRRSEGRDPPCRSGGVSHPSVCGRCTTWARPTTPRAQSPKRLRAVRLRDGKCRVPGCERRTGLEAHHLWPASWGGSDEIHNLAMVCTGGSTDHHAHLVPQGPWILAGNPKAPNGLTLVHRDDLPTLAARTASQARARRGPP